MPSYHVQKHGHLPRIHLIECEIIEDFISKGLFKGYYEFSSMEYNDVYDRNTKKTYSNESLEVCRFCSKKVLNNIHSTENFYQSLGTEIPKNRDIFGYDKNWHKISQQYRESKNYMCERCGIKLKENSHKRFWHVHHKDGNKISNDPSNLECLCVLCHSHKDMQHEENFGRSGKKRELDSFVKTYSEELKKLNNPYLRYL
jgi:5-methylcytosine-specific restriction endonuclease McrA